MSPSGECLYLTEKQFSISGLAAGILTQDISRAHRLAAKVHCVDAKAWPVVEPLGKLIRRSEVDDRICIGAFNDERIFKVCQLVGRPLCHSIGVNSDSHITR